MIRRNQPQWFPSLSCRAGVTLLEVGIISAVIALLAALAFPIGVRWRETARRTACRDHLKTLFLAMRQYEETQGALPAAADWEFHTNHGLDLHESKQIETITHANWAIHLLPYLDQSALFQEFDLQQPIGSSVNEKTRTTRLSVMTCPADTFNSRRNPHEFFPRDGAEIPLLFARGNYAMNGGTHNIQTIAPSTRAPLGDMLHLFIQESPRRFQMWGNGIAGINKSFSSREFKNGLSTLVALEEVRAGIHPLDPRGVWALGQIGGSLTWGHGVNGDAFAPNHQWNRSDDLLGGGMLHELLGEEKLLQERMPCVSYVDANAQATARSQHSGGVHVAFCDGSVRFISDRIDPGLWHVIHSRETPAQLLTTRFEADLVVEDFPEESPPTHENNSGPLLERLQNSLGMEFILIPAGTFQMGIPDRGNDVNPPPECPEHTVTISRPFLMGIHEVTVKQFQQIFPQAMSRQPAGSSREIETYPITEVTWDKADEFCKRLSQSAEELKAGRVYRLPTEAEWEYVCRAGANEPYDWKRSRDPADASGEMGGISPALPLKPVGSYPANPWGVYDMRGNVWEWTADWFDRDYYLRSSQFDPQGPSHGYLKVVRGGDWRFIGENCRIDYPILPPWKGNPFVGFRVVCMTNGQGSLSMRGF